MDRSLIYRRAILGGLRPLAIPPETRHLFRPQRGSLRQAMMEARDFDGTRAGLQGCLGCSCVLVAVEPYGGIDTRIGWDTHIVIARYPDGTEQPAGFTNGPVVD